MRIVIVFIIEAAVVGILYGVAGFYIGDYAVDFLSKNISTLIPLLKGLTITIDSKNLFMLSIVVSMLVSSLSAIIPAIFAANLSLFRDMKRY